MAAAEAKKRRKPQKWNGMVPVKAYRFARQGINPTDTARLLGVSKVMFYKWLKDRPELKEALELAKADAGGDGTFPSWVYARLSPELKALWDKIDNWSDQKNGYQKITELLADHGARTRQQLFLHALCVSAFNPSEAMRKVGVSKRELDRWAEADPDFCELVEEIDYHKKNFFEGSLVQLVAAGDPSATTFANKTVNADRGYAVKGSLDVQHSGAVLHGVLDLADLLPYLSDVCRLEVLEAIRKRERALPAAVESALPDPVAVLENEIAEAANQNGGGVSTL